MLGLPVLLPRCLFLAMVSLFLIDSISIFLLNVVSMLIYLYVLIHVTLLFYEKLNPLKIHLI